MPSECPGNIRDQDVRNAGGAPPAATAGLRRVTIPAAIAAVLVTVVGVSLALPGKSAAVIVVAATATLVAAGGTAFIFIRGPESIGPDIAALLTVGFAGVALAGLLPNTPGFVMVYVAMAALGMRAPPIPAIMAGLAVLAAMNLAALLAGALSVSDLVSQDVGAAFVFAVGAFTRSARIGCRRGRAADAGSRAGLVEGARHQIAGNLPPRRRGLPARKTSQRFARTGPG